MENNENNIEELETKTEPEVVLTEVPVEEPAKPIPNNRNSFIYIAFLLIILIFGVCGILFAFKGGNTINMKNLDPTYYTKNISIKLPDNHYIDYDGYVYGQDNGILYSRFLIFVDEVSEKEFNDYVLGTISDYPFEASSLNGGTLYVIKGATVDGSAELYNYFFYFKDGVAVQINSLSEDYNMVISILKSLKVGK